MNEVFLDGRPLYGHDAPKAFVVRWKKTDATDPSQDVPDGMSIHASLIDASRHLLVRTQHLHSFEDFGDSLEPNTSFPEGLRKIVGGEEPRARIYPINLAYCEALSEVLKTEPTINLPEIEAATGAEITHIQEVREAAKCFPMETKIVAFRVCANG